MRIIVPILTLFLLTIAAYIWTFASLWTIDDYLQVYGIYANPIRSFVEGLARSDQGLITPHRLLMYWFIGVGGFVGPAAAHTLALVMHFLCTLLFGGLVWRLFRSPMLAFLSSGWFVVAPWITQPVLWWSAVSTTVSTICLLIAAHFFLNSFSARTVAPRLWWLVMAWLATFLGLCFYELWIAGFLLFVGIGFALPSNDELEGAWGRRTTSVAAMAVPFALWSGLVALVGPQEGQADRLAVLERVPFALGLLHLRVVNWIKGPDWLALLKMGIDSLGDPFAASAFVVGSGLLLLIFTEFAAKKPKPKHPIAKTIGRPNTLFAASQQLKYFSADRFPWTELFLAWMIFLASRLILILQGQVPSESRFNYGAGMAVAVAAAALARWVWHSWCRRSLLLRWSAVIGAVASIALMTLATAGRTRHMALISQAEAYTLVFLEKVSRQHPEIRSVTVMGTPVPAVGELNYFSDEGMPTAILRKLGYDKRVRLVRSNDSRGNRSDSQLSFRWSGYWPEATLEPAFP